jgi:hypothetical protein
MSQYSTGTATVTNNNATVTGTNTLWLANVSAGDSFTIASTGVMYDVASVDSDTQVTLSAPYAGTTASGVVYAIGTGFTVPDNFPEMSQGDIETATIFTRAMRKIQGKISALVSDISGKAAIAGQTFTGDIAAPKITASTGILFGTDTAAANTLDDYEEGTWTPASTELGELTILRANYTKIGDTVRLFAQVTASSTTTVNLDNAVIIRGIPISLDSGEPRGVGGSIQFYASHGDNGNALGDLITAGNYLESEIIVVRGAFTYAECASITISLTYKAA